MIEQTTPTPETDASVFLSWKSMSDFININNKLRQERDEARAEVARLRDELAGMEKKQQTTNIMLRAVNAAHTKVDAENVRLREREEKFVRALQLAQESVESWADSDTLQEWHIAVFELTGTAYPLRLEEETK